MAPKPATLPPDLAGERIVRPAHFAAMAGCSPSHLYRLAQAGKLPRPIRLSHRVSGWQLADVRQFLRGRAA